MNKNRCIISWHVIAVLLPLVLSACFGPWQGERDKAENGWLIIGKDTQAKTAVPDSEELDGMTYRITLTGPGGKIERALGNGGGAIDIAVGDWQYSITAWNSEPRLRGFAGGNLRVTPGGRSIITLKSAVGLQSARELQDILNNDTLLHKTYVDKEGGNTFLVLEQDITLVNNINFTGQSPFFLIAEPGKNHTIHWGNGYSISVQVGTLTLGNGDLPGATGTLILNGEGSTGGSFIKVDAFGNLKIRDGVVIQNSRSNNSGAVYVAANGTFTMEGGNINGNTTNSSGGGVFVDGGTFTMKGGTISGNTAPNGDGGGVYVDNGTFTMEGGTISGNTTQSNGGGVYILAGIFTMRDGSIKGNTSDSLDGGGVYINGGGTFTMEGGTISGNTAQSNGGGVCIYLGTFKKTGGTIYGKNTDVNSNTVGSGNTHGHTVYYSYYDNNRRNYKNYYRDITAGPAANIDTTIVPPLGFENQRITGSIQQRGVVFLVPAIGNIGGAFGGNVFYGFVRPQLQ